MEHIDNEDAATTMPLLEQVMTYLIDPDCEVVDDDGGEDINDDNLAPSVPQEHDGRPA